MLSGDISWIERGVKGQIRVQAEIESFLHGLAAGGECAANTVSAYRNDLRQLVGYLARTFSGSTWSEISSDVVRAYVQYLWDRGYAPSTVARKISTLRSFCRFLVGRGIIDSDPMAVVDMPTVEWSPREPLSPEAVSRLLAVPAKCRTPIGLRDHALLELLYATGLRASEVVRLDVEDVSLASGTVCSVTREKERIIPLSSRARGALASYMGYGRLYLMQNREERALFLNYRGQRLTRQGLWLLVRGYAQEAGLASRISPQAFRNSFAACLLSEGVEVTELQELLGHASVHTTQFYADSQDRQDVSQG